MELRTLFLAAFVVTVSLKPAALLAQEDGAYLFKTYCAICHEAVEAGEVRAPGPDVLKQMTPEHILQVLETGAMKTQAAERSRAQRRSLAEYSSGKTFGNVAPDVLPRSAFCTNASTVLPESPNNPEWNGWGVTITNTRFESTAAAGLAANVFSTSPLVTRPSLPVPATCITVMLLSAKSLAAAGMAIPAAVLPTTSSGAATGVGA